MMSSQETIISRGRGDGIVIAMRNTAKVHQEIAEKVFMADEHHRRRRHPGQAVHHRDGTPGHKRLCLAVGVRVQILNPTRLPSHHAQDVERSMGTGDARRRERFVATAKNLDTFKNAVFSGMTPIRDVPTT